MRFPSLQELFGLMVTRGAETASEAVAGIPADTTLIPMSVRVHPRAKAYYEAQADACGAASASAMVAMVLEGVMAATKGPAPAGPASATDAARGRVSIVRERFFHLFDIHGFTARMMADALQPHGITLADLMDDARLLPLLTDEVLEGHAGRFNASVEWLHGGKQRPVIDRVPEYNKRPEWVCKRIVDLLLEGQEVTAIFLRDKDHNFGAAFDERPGDVGSVGLVLRTAHRTASGKGYHRYEPWQPLPWDYDQVRFSVKALILWLQRLGKVSVVHRVRIEGREIDREVLRRLGRGDLHPAEVLEESGWPRRWSSWDPDDYVAEAVHRFPGRTAPNPSAREAHERPAAMRHYGFWELDKELKRLPHINVDHLAKPIGQEWDE